jgi:hypothetical protein
MSQARPTPPVTVILHAFSAHFALIHGYGSIRNAVSARARAR